MCVSCCLCVCVCVYLVHVRVCVCTRRPCVLAVVREAVITVSPGVSGLPFNAYHVAIVPDDEIKSEA